MISLFKEKICSKFETMLILLSFLLTLIFHLSHVPALFKDEWQSLFLILKVM